jgi:hypothetical protein
MKFIEINLRKTLILNKNTNKKVYRKLLYLVPGTIEIFKVFLGGRTRHQMQPKKCFKPKKR